MRANLHASVALILRHEGGYVDHPRDPGGCTHMGITLGTYRAHLDPGATCNDLRAMTRATAERVYRDSYWSAVNADHLPPGVDLCVFDMGVNAGPRRAVRLLQQVLGGAQDGVVGPLTLAAAWRHDDRLMLAALVSDYAHARMRYYRGLSTWDVFGRGWTARVKATEREAQRLVAESAALDDDERPDDAAAPGVAEDFSAAGLLVDLPTIRDLGVHPASVARQVAAYVVAPATAEGVRAYQRAAGLAPDGVIGPRTWRQIAADLHGGA